MKYLFVLLILGLMLPSCVVYNATKYAKSDTCEVHHIKMKKALVGTRYGRAAGPINQKEYINAKAPILRGCVVPLWPIKRLALAYHCKQCNRVNRTERKMDRKKN